MIKLDIRSTDADPDVGEDYQERVRDFMQEAADIGFGVSQELAPEDRGLLKSTAVVPEFRNKKKRIVFGYTQPYAGEINYGGEPRWVPIDPLIAWAKRRGKDEGFAYAVQHKIAQEGVDDQPYLDPPAHDAVRRFLKTNEP
jgi:hypothetical protein